MKNLARILTGSLILLAATVCATTVDEEFEKGKLAYQDKSWAEAFHHFTNAAEAGHTDAQVWLGSMYQSDEYGLKADWVKMYDWYEKAAQNGHARAALRMAQRVSIYWTNSSDESEAIPLYERAAEAGHPDAMYWLASVYNPDQEHHADKEKELYWTKRAAEAGHRDGQLQLAKMYSSGYGLDRDGEQAIKWLKASATNGNREAQFHYGAALFEGAMGQVNKKEGLEWVKLAARNQYPVAYGFIAMLYLKGDTVEQNSDLAYSLMVEAVKLGDGNAAFKLAELFAGGDLGEVDVETALTWLNIAEFLKHPNVAHAKNVMQKMFVYEPDTVENAADRAGICQFYEYNAKTCSSSNMSKTEFEAQRRALEMFNENNETFFGADN